MFLPLLGRALSKDKNDAWQIMQQSLLAGESAIRPKTGPNAGYC